MQHTGPSAFTAAHRIFSWGMQTLSCGMWDLFPWPGIEPTPPALGTWSLTHWTTREVPRCMFVWEQSPDFPSFLDILECHWKGTPAVLYTLSAINSHWILKSRDITLPTKVRLVKAMVFFSSHVWMWELDHKEWWVPKNWWFWTVMLEKTWESLELQGDQTSQS